jgi:hypothetical protein
VITVRTNFRRTGAYGIRIFAFGSLVLIIVSCVLIIGGLVLIVGGYIAVIGGFALIIGSCIAVIGSLVLTIGGLILITGRRIFLIVRRVLIIGGRIAVGSFVIIGRLVLERGHKYRIAQKDKIVNVGVAACARRVIIRGVYRLVFLFVFGIRPTEKLAVRRI